MFGTQTYSLLRSHRIFNLGLVVSSKRPRYLEALEPFCSSLRKPRLIVMKRYATEQRVVTDKFRER